MRRVLVIVGVMLALLFVSQNLDPVEISLVLGRPVEVPLALVVAAAFLGGLLAGVALILGGRLRRKRSVEELNEEDEAGIDGEIGR